MTIQTTETKQYQDAFLAQVEPQGVEPHRMEPQEVNQQVLPVGEMITPVVTTSKTKEEVSRRKEIWFDIFLLFAIEGLATFLFAFFGSYWLQIYVGTHISALKNVEVPVLFSEIVLFLAASSALVFGRNIRGIFGIRGKDPLLLLGFRPKEKT